MVRVDQVLSRILHRVSLCVDLVLASKSVQVRVALFSEKKSYAFETTVERLRTKR